MGEATGPLPAIGGTVQVIAVSELVLAKLCETQDLLRQVAAGRAPGIDLVVMAHRLAEMEDAYRRGVMTELTRTALEAPPVLAAVPRPVQRGQHRPRRGREPGTGQLKLIQGIAAAALLPLRRLAPHLAHPVAAAKAAGAVKVAGIAAAGSLTAAGVVAVTAAVVMPASPHAGAFGGVPAPAATAYAAVPVPGPSLIARLTRPKAGTDAHGASRELAGPPVAPPLLPSSSVSSQPSRQPASSQPSAQSPQGGPAVLTVGVTSLDLSVFSSATVTLTATGSGFVAWHADTTGTDLDFSADHGVLAAGQSYQLVVSLDPAQDGNAAQVFDVDGQQVTVTLPAPAPVVTPTPTDTSTDVPNVAPSPASS